MATDRQSYRQNGEACQCEQDYAVPWLRGVNLLYLSALFIQAALCRLAQQLQDRRHAAEELHHLRGMLKKQSSRSLWHLCGRRAAFCCCCTSRGGGLFRFWGQRE